MKTNRLPHLVGIVLLALCMVVVPVLAQVPPQVSLTKTCTTPIVSLGENAIFNVVFENLADEGMYVTFDEDLTGANCPLAGVEVMVNVGESLNCQVIVPTTAGGLTVDNTIGASVTTFSGRQYEPSASDSCQIEATSVPEFPSMFLPMTMIIGILGAVLLIQRTREH